MGIPEIFNYLGAKRNVEAKILKKKSKNLISKKNKIQNFFATTQTCLNYLDHLL